MIFMACGVQSVLFSISCQNFTGFGAMLMNQFWYFGCTKSATRLQVNPEIISKHHNHCLFFVVFYSKASKRKNISKDKSYYG